MVEPAKWMIDSTSWSAISSATSDCVADIADDRQHRLRQRGGKAGGEVVEHDDALAGIDQRMHGVAADIACASRDQYGHGFPSRFAESLSGAAYKSG